MRNEYGYNDKELWEDGDLNWLDYGFRNYDPQIGRFLQIDPLSDEYEDLSPYLYAYNDPIGNVDEDGLFASSALNAVGQAVNNTLPEVIVKSTIKKAVASKAKQSLLKTFFNKVAEELATTLENIGSAVLGATNAWTSNQVLGVGRMNPEASGFRGRLGTSVRIGMALGDAASIVTGGIEVGSSGVGLVLTGGVVTPLAVPVAIHGTTSMGLGVYHLVNSNIVYSTSSESQPATTSSSSQSPKYHPSSEADKIGDGHAWDKHRGEFPEIKSREQFKHFIDKVKNSPTSLYRKLKRGREAWYDKDTNTFVIKDPKSNDGGTMFRPKNKMKYFNEQLN